MEIPSRVRKIHYTKVDIERHVLKYQLYGNLQRHKRYVQYETDGLNQYQNFLYDRAVNGLAAYEPVELKRMKPKTIKWIQNTHNRTQRVLNIWKQEITNDLTNVLFDLCFFNKGNVKQPILDATRNFVDPNKKNKLSFKSLGIKKQDIIKKLIAEKILPGDFYELKPKT